MYINRVNTHTQVGLLPWEKKKKLIDREGVSLNKRRGVVGRGEEGEGRGGEEQQQTLTFSQQCWHTLQVPSWFLDLTIPM